MRSKPRGIVFGIFMLTMLAGLFGCAEKYTVDDIVGVSLFESGMDRNAGYSYGLVREGDSWYLSAECGNVGRHEHFDCRYLPVGDDPIPGVIGVIHDSGYIKKTRSKKLLDIFAPDAPDRGVMLTFSDSTTQSAAISAPELLEEFVRLVTALEAGIPVHTADETTGLYLSASCMNADEAYSFELFRDDGWHFSADCLVNGSRITLENVRIADEDADKLIGTAFDEELAMKVFTYRGLPCALAASDDDRHSISMRFGKTLQTADIRSEALENRFFDLAEKYSGNNFTKEE